MTIPEGWINAGDFSATANGLNSAVHHAVEEGYKGLWIPKRSGGYTINSTVTVPAGVRVEQHAPIVYTGSTASPAIVYGTAGVANAHAVWRGLRVSRAPGWSGTFDGVGVRLINPQHAQIAVLEANGFDVGIQLLGNGAEARGAWLEVGSLHDCRIAVHLRSVAGGRVRDNRIFGGHQVRTDLAVSGNDTTLPRYHYVADSNGGTPGDDVGNILVHSLCNFRADQSSGECAFAWLKTPYNWLFQVGVGPDANVTGNASVAIVDGAAAHHNTVWLGCDVENLGAAQLVSRNGAPGSNAFLSVRSMNPAAMGGFTF